MNFVDATRLAHHEILSRDPSSLIIGLGVSYPNGADGTTKGLANEFPNRVLDVPTSELAITGAAVGMAARGLRPIVHHGRVEFALLAFDQILTQAARWNFMFGGDYPCPIVLRICIGRQWGNGPQHTANYHSIFLQATGLDVYIPASPSDAYAALKAASIAQNPAVILEHRWLYKTTEEFPSTRDSISSMPVASIYGDGEDFTVLTYADGLVDALGALEHCSKANCRGKVICVKHFPGNKRHQQKLLDQINRSRRIVIVDPAPFDFGLLAGIAGQTFGTEKTADAERVKIVCPPFEACPTSPKLVGEYYPNPAKIVSAVAAFGFDVPKFRPISFDELHLPPSFNFSAASLGKRVDIFAD
jgi:acetoin:2,6-dichlorophenolindophenol oxidoreductase subunit beta